MGTSQGHGMPKGGAWTSAKRSATTFAQSPRGTSPSEAISAYVGALGGGRVVSAAKGSTIGSAARSTGTNLDGFLGTVFTDGLQAALEASRLSGLVGKTASEILNGLLDAFAGDGSTLDEVAARRALL